MLLPVCVDKNKHWGWRRSSPHPSVWLEKDLTQTLRPLKRDLNTSSQSLESDSFFFAYSFSGATSITIYTLPHAAHANQSIYFAIFKPNKSLKAGDRSLNSWVASVCQFLTFTGEESAIHLPVRTGNNCAFLQMLYDGGQSCSAWLDFTVVCSLTNICNSSLKQDSQLICSASVQFLCQYLLTITSTMSCDI